MASRIEVQYRGKTYEATYKIAHGMATVRSICGKEESVQIGGMTEEWAAKEALRSLLVNADACGRLELWSVRCDQ